jgi:hypothetical protein
MNGKTLKSIYESASEGLLSKNTASAAPRSPLGQAFNNSVAGAALKVASNLHPVSRAATMAISH